MGKRKKSSKPMGPKKREPLATSFKCVFCSNETSVSVKLDKKGGIGTLSCRQCGQSFQTTTELGNLTQPVDVYYEWIDACDAVAKDEAGTASSGMPSVRPSQPSASARAGLAPGEKETEEDTRFIDDDDVDAEADYGDD